MFLPQVCDTLWSGGGRAVLDKAVHLKWLLCKKAIRVHLKWLACVNQAWVKSLCP